MSEWHGGKGSKTRPNTTPQAELELRDRLWRAPESEKPAILEKLNKLVEDRKAHGLYSGAFYK